MGDLVGGTFPLSLQHDGTAQQGALGSVLLQELHFNNIPSSPLVVTQDPTSCKGGGVSSSPEQAPVSSNSALLSQELQEFPLDTLFLPIFSCYDY